MVHKGGVLIFCGMYLTSRKIMSFYEVKVVVQKGGGLRSGKKKLTIVDVLVSFNYCFHPLLSYDHSPQ